MAYSSNKQIDDILTFIDKTWGLTVNKDRIADWEKELTDGAGRDISALRSDIFNYVVGADNVKQWVKQEFENQGMDVGTGSEPEDKRLARISDELMTGKRNFSDFASDLTGLGGSTDNVIKPDGSTDTLPGFMAGGTLRKVKNPEGQPDFYVMEYEYPPGSGHSFYYRFESLDTVKASAGEDLAGVQLGQDINESVLANWTDGGDSNEIVGVEGSFYGYIQDITRDVAAKAGISDPTRLGDALASPDIQLIMAKAAEGDWTDAQIKAEMRKSSYYKDVLYPGIENFYGQTDSPEDAYNLYQRNVTSGLESLGIPKDADGTYNTKIKDMLDSGIDDTEFAGLVPTYLRATANDEYRTSLNKWLIAAGQPPITDFNSFFDVLEGTAPPEVQQIVELAGISFVASQQGSTPGEDMIREIANRTDLSESEIANSFLQSDRDLLALGADGLRRAGLTQQDIIATRAGFTTGNRSLAEMGNLIGKVKTELGISDDPTAKYFTSYDSSGRPIKAGLKSTLNEGA